nr:hypothetical protein CFP56_09593 [Quercus suber]
MLCVDLLRFMARTLSSQTFFTLCTNTHLNTRQVSIRICNAWFRVYKELDQFWWGQRASVDIQRVPTHDDFCATRGSLHRMCRRSSYMLIAQMRHRLGSLWDEAIPGEQQLTYGAGSTNTTPVAYT